uniref:Uncharacterized protein n=1 Tax=Panagrolaimus davidi TaxID=227884 RepID=A0A914Q3Z8_9BILA
MSTLRKSLNDPIFEYSKVNYTNKSAIVTLKVQNESMFIVLYNERNKQWMIQHVKIQTGKKTGIFFSFGR